MTKTLVKFKQIDDMSEGYIDATYSDRPTETLRIAKEVCSIKISEDWYKFCSSEFIPATNISSIDVIYIYVEKYGDEGAF